MAQAPFTKQTPVAGPPTAQPQRTQSHGSEPTDTSTPFKNLSANPGPMPAPSPAPGQAQPEGKPFKNLSSG